MTREQRQQCDHEAPPSRARGAPRLAAYTLGQRASPSISGRGPATSPTGRCALVRTLPFLALLGCHGADPDWDLYALQSWRLADLPSPVLVVEVVGRAPDRALEVRLDADIPCPIPLATAVEATVAGHRMSAVPGDTRGNGIGKSCSNPVFRAPASDVPPGPVEIVLSDGNTAWTLGLSDPLAPRELVPERAMFHPGEMVRARPSPPSDRWIPDPPGVRPTTVQVTSREADPVATCAKEAEAPVPDPAPDWLEVQVPWDFCAGPAYVGLSGSARRMGVTSCPAGVACRFELSGFVAPIVVAPADPR